MFGCGAIFFDADSSPPPGIYRDHLQSIMTRAASSSVAEKGRGVAGGLPGLWQRGGEALRVSPFDDESCDS
jgi:hypothetical protein